MTQPRFADQAFLIAVQFSPRDGMPAHVAVGAVGERAWHEIAMTSPTLGEFMENHGDWPDESGFHVWEGTIVPNPLNDRKYSRFEGEWRRAEVRDFDRFGLALPRPTIQPRVAAAH